MPVSQLFVPALVVFQSIARFLVGVLWEPQRKVVRVGLGLVGVGYFESAPGQMEEGVWD